MKRNLNLLIMFIPYCSVKSTTEQLTLAFKRKATWKKKKITKTKCKTNNSNGSSNDGRKIFN